MDIGKVESNIARMASFLADKTCRLRPHVKTHKTAVLAHKQIAAGAVGMCAAKLGEAEMLVAGGVRDVLVANEIVGPTKIARLVALAHHSDIMVAVDEASNARDIGAVARASGVTVRVLVDVNVGQNRCGAEPYEPARRLAREVAEIQGLRLCGVMGYEGHLVFLPDREEKGRKARESMAKLTETAELIRQDGLADAPIVSGGGTGTHEFTAAYPGVTELQAGSYITMDGRYRDLGMPFDTALTVLASVVSRQRPNVVILDVGMKAISHEFGYPYVLGVPGARISRMSEEHGIVELEDPDAVSLKPGDKVFLLPTHGDTTINLHDRYFVVRDGVLETVWDVAGRGKSR
jgi:D-serine deaminase-like pyridoxal phosphate-dependent protein